MIQTQIDSVKGDNVDNKNRIGIIEESIMNAKKSVNSMGKKVMQVVDQFQEQNEKNKLTIDNTKLEFTDLCHFQEREFNELVRQLEVKVIQVRKMAEDNVVKKQQILQATMEKEIIKMNDSI